MSVTLFFNGSFYANLIKLDAINKLINYEALLYGKVFKETEISINDSQEHVELEKVNVLCLGLLPFTDQFVFYDSRGVVDSKIYEKFKLENGCQLIGIYRCRPDTPHSTLSLLEKSLCLNLNKLNSIFKQNDVNKFIFILNTNNQIKNLKHNIVIKNQHQVFLYDELVSKFEQIPFQVKNIGIFLNYQLKYSNPSRFSRYNNENESIGQNLNSLYSSVNNLNTKLCNDLKETVKKLTEQEITLKLLKNESNSNHFVNDHDNKCLDQDVLIIEKNKNKTEKPYNSS